MDNREPVFNVPGTVIAVLALLIALHVIREFLPIEDGTWLLLAMAFIPARYAGMLPWLDARRMATRKPTCAYTATPTASPSAPTSPSGTAPR